jgi:hypothetical protein
VRGGSTCAIIALICNVASADPAADLVKRGIEQYRTGKYADSAQTLKKAYDLDGKAETLFALAQAERLAGDCPSAIDHYKQVTAKVSDLNVAKLVEQSLQLCAPTEPTPIEHHDEPPPPLPPRIVEKTVVREVPRTDRLVLTFAGVGALSLGGAFGLLVAATGNQTAAQHAYTQADYTSFERRYTDEGVAAVVAAGVGVALLGAATVRWLKNDRTGADVVVVPTGSGATVSLTGRW